MSDNHGTAARTTGPLLALTASDLMSPDVVTISQDTPLRTAAELFSRRHIPEAAVVDADGRCVGMLTATDLLHWALEGAPADEDVPRAACLYQVRGQLLGGPDAVICTAAPGSCPLQQMRATTAGRHTAVCLLPDAVVNDWQQSRRVPVHAVGRCRTADVATVGVETPLSVLARTLIEAHLDRLIVVDDQHRPIGIVSCTDVLAALPAAPAPRWALEPA
jgi:CBS domain-containing protein